MPIWEYYSISNLAATEERLNEMGRDGWELVNITEDRAYFKRPIDEPPETDQ